MKTREVECDNPEIGCNPKTKPSEEQQCANITCGTWKVSDWLACTRTCGGGIQLRRVTCEGGHECPSHLKPPMERDCYWVSCEDAHHSPGEESSSTSTTAGEEGEEDKEQKATGRDQETDDILKSERKDSDIKIYGDDDFENQFNLNSDQKAERASTKPDVESSTTAPTSTSVKPDRHHRWIPLFWGECSKPCGGGFKTRKSMCINKLNMKELDGKECAGMTAPATIQQCNQQPCTQHWMTSEWMECSATCGQGMQGRDVTCPEPDQCDLNDKPTEKRTCLMPACNMWVADIWQKCSKTCGGGKQVRQVKCLNETTQEAAEDCDPRSKPSTEKECNTDKCPGSCKGDEMSYQICKALKKRGKCKETFVQRKCCRTCHDNSRSQKITGSTS